MSILVSLHHRTRYEYDRLVQLGPQTIRLRPAPHARTPVVSYSLKIEPEEHFENWQQDPYGNFVMRAVFPKPVKAFEVTVNVVADMTVINPFDFFIEDVAEHVPFKYAPDLAEDLKPYLKCEPMGPRMKKWLESVDMTPRRTVDFLVDLNLSLEKSVEYLIRMEPGVQSCEETLTKGSGSCRDSSWLLVQILRNLGFAARFASGYLIQLTPDVKSLDGPSGTEIDFTDLHAWTEVYLPGAGWIGLDPTSGLLTGEGHIPLACTPHPSSAAPISGAVLERCESQFDFEMNISRFHETPRVTKPYREDQWEQIQSLGVKIDQDLKREDVRLTMGGEPTFVSIDDMEGEEWNGGAVGEHKRRLSLQLIRRLAARFAPGSLLHFGQGKWYPGESLPRWAFACYWRADGQPIWRHPELIAEPQSTSTTNTPNDTAKAKRFLQEVANQLEISPKRVRPAFEDIWHHLADEQRLPIDIQPDDPRLSTSEDRVRLAKVLETGFDQPTGFVLPLQRQWWQGKAQWYTGQWPTRAQRIYLLPGDSPIGLRLPLDSLPTSISLTEYQPFLADPTVFYPPLPVQQRRDRVVSANQSALEKEPEQRQPPLQMEPIRRMSANEGGVGFGLADESTDLLDEELDPNAPVVRTAICSEFRQGAVHVFMPPVESTEDYVDLIDAVEAAAIQTKTPVVLEGYTPPHDARIQNVKVTPDPGVIEVNTRPVASWQELVDETMGLYEEARQCRLGTEKFDLDGRHTGTGGGNHIVLGGPTPLDSPFLRRPDLLASLIAYWNNHPSLSYLFSSSFIGPTSQAPRVDEGRRDAIYELEIALDQLHASKGNDNPPWMVDRTLRNLLIDLTGNTHRAEFCIDKLYSPDSSTGRLGLVEFRGFEMPPHPQMSLTQQLLIRSLVGMFWQRPYEQKLIHWDTSLHDRFLLPHYSAADFKEVIADLNRFGYEFDPAWFDTHFEFRFPFIGKTERVGIELELRQAIEPWYVLGEEPGAGGTTRYVDSSVERLQVKLTGVFGDRYQLLCNGFVVPLRETGVQGELIAGIRYRAWQPPNCLHPNIPVHTPLTFEIVDTWNQLSLGGCQYHVAHPAGRNYETFPVNAYEAEGRRVSRFFEMGQTGNKVIGSVVPSHPDAPVTLDLRRASQRHN